MGGLHFINLGFLAGALAVAVPVVIHLLFRHRPRQVNLGTLQFLAIALRDQARRRRLKRWLLLALRIAGVLLLALLFARPYWSQASDVPGAGEVVVLIDQSASMGAGSGGRTPFRKAQEQAAALIRGLPDGVKVELAYYDDSGVEPAARDAISSTRSAGYGGTDHGKALGWARDVLATSTHPDQRVYLYSDLQRSGVGRTEFDRWPKKVPIEVIDVGKDLANIVAVIDARVDRAIIGGAEPPTVSAVVANTGLFPVEEIAVRLALKGKAGTVALTQTVAIDSGERQPVTFPLPKLRPGFYEGSVSVKANDQWPLDDHRWLTLNATTTAKVLLVDGSPGASVFESSTYYLEMALRLRLPGPGATTTPYEPARIDFGPGRHLPALKDYRVVVASSVADWSDADAAALRDYVLRGGRLLLFPGDGPINAARDPLRRFHLSPAEMMGSSDEEACRLATWDKEHPIFRALSDPQHGDLRRLEFRRHARLKVDSDARVLATLDDGAPFLVEKTLGSGHVLLFAVAADRDAGEWVVSRLYLPLIHETLGYLAGRRSDADSSPGATTGPGRSNPPGLEKRDNRVVSRNLDPAESDTERLSPRDFRRTYGLPNQGPNSRDREAARAIAPPPGTQRPDEYWRTLAWMLFAVLLVETFVANRTQT